MKKQSRLTRYTKPLLALAALFALPSHAGVTDIATAPLFTTTTTVVKPNVLFTLDDSGSMAWDFMPDDADFGSSGYNHKYGRRASQCNGLAYNHKADKQAYSLPVTSTGAEVSAASMAFLSGTVLNAKDVNYLSSGYVTNTRNQRSVTSPATLTTASSGTFTLTLGAGSNSSYFTGMVVTIMGASGGSYDNSRYMIGKVTDWNSPTRTLKVAVEMSVGSGDMSSIYVGDGSAIDNVYYTYSGSQKTAVDFQYPGNVLKTDSTFYLECNSSITGATGKAVFTATIVTPSSSEAQRYANWYHYYSTRMRMMKTSLTLAFKDIDDRYRVGFMTINENTGGILDVSDFNATQKASFYSRINGAVPDNSTPLRAALSRAGSYYAKKVSGQTYDPAQYSCQKNFTILSTDGYWNGSAGYDLAGAAVGNQDGGLTERAMYDGGLNVVTTKDTWDVTSTYDRTTTTPITTKKVTTKVDTTYAPYQGQSRKTYALTTYPPLANSSIGRCSSGTSGACTITVTTSSNHGLSTNNSVTIAGASPSVYNGTFTITKINSTQYSYTLPSRPSSDTATGTTWHSSYSPVGCGPNQGKQTEQLQTRDLRHVTKVTTVTTDTTPKTRVLVERFTTVTPYTRTQVTTNGVAAAATTSAGSATTTTTTVSDTTTSDATTSVTPTPGSETLADDTTSWVNSGVAVQTTPATCITTASSTSASTNIAKTTADVVNSATTVSGPTDTNGADSSTSTAPVTTTGATTTTTTGSTSGGSSDSLADVAMYYYQTDLRTSGLGNCTGSLGLSVCDNNVNAVGDEDKATWQHMTTYTLSLGMNGTLTYIANYTSEPGDYKKIKEGTLDWPVPSSDGGAVNIDDLWHAAVNGRGRYFSASNPTALASSLVAALSSIDSKAGSTSAAATSTLQPVEGDNGVYIARFQSSEWTGDLRAYRINPDDGTVTTSVLGTDGKPKDTADWRAQEQLSSASTRTIYYLKPGGGLREFTYANLTADGLNGHVDNACSKSPALTQCSSLSGASLTSANSGSNMVNFLRGQADAQYRTRAQVLGDIVNSSPVYVGKPSFRYTEAGYASFKTAQALRSPTIYVGANDGMLHAFDASADKTKQGKERWAYIPSMVMPNLYKLGDSAYESKHQYYVDATPVAGDIYVGGAWKTILVGGLNAGGKGYFAIDITNPDAPVALWEFTHANLGLSYGNPVITKRKDGTWVVAVTSGYNNADGGGHLFVLDANTGALLKTVSTGAGTAGDPSGLGKLNAWVDYDTENLAKRFYAGDLLGNVWRFDIDDLVEPKSSAFKLATLQKGSVAQPITTVPQLAEIESGGIKYAVVYLGTGQYLGKSDVENTAVQSVYAIKDVLGADTLGDVRGGGTLVQQEMETNSTETVRNVKSGKPVDWGLKNGWFVDLMTPGERINVDMQLAFNKLTAAGNIPGGTATDCTDSGAGKSWLYQFDVATGTSTPERLSSMVAGLSTVQLAKGTGLTIVTKTDVSDPLPKTIDPSSASSSRPRRSSWRELVD